MEKEEEDIANELTGILPGELMLDILSRLSVKSLVKFSCVKKSWFNLLKKPWFIKMYYNRSLKDDSLITSQKNYTKLESELSIFRPGSSKPESIGVSEPGMIAIVGSSNGLVCLTYVDQRYGLHFKVINPALKQYHNVYKKASGRIHEVVDLIEHISVGFGFDEKSGDFKILRVERVDEVHSSYFEAKLYSLRSNSWKTIKTSADLVFRTAPSSATIGSCIYWLSLADNGASIIGFDLSSETFHKISPPVSRYMECMHIVARKHEPWVVIFSDRLNYSYYEMWTVSPDQIRMINNNNNNKDSWKKNTACTEEEILECVRKRPVFYYRESLVPLHRSLEVSKGKLVDGML